MAEVLAIGASLIAIIQISDRIVGLCKHYIQNVQDAPSDLRLILLETSAIKTIFENLNFLTACDSGVSNIVSGLAGVDGPVEGCLKSVIQLEKLFSSDWTQKAGRTRSKKQKVKTTLAALAWPLKETKARKLLDEILRYKTTVTLAITTQSFQDIKEIKAKAVEVHSLLTESQRQEVYRWLQHTDPSSLHFNARKDYEPGTCSWMLRAPEWSSWLNARERCLWIHGIPGSGKTVLMSYLIEQIEQHYSNSRMGKCASVYYYCYYGRTQNETAPFLRWLINQLCRKAHSVPRSVHELYEHGVEPNIEELLAAVEAILEEFDSTYIAIDALDESIPRDDLLQILKTLATDSRFKKLQLLVSSREYIDIEKVMDEFSASVSMANPYIVEDIKVYVRSALKANSKFKRWPQDLLDEVETSLSTGARGMFRWAVCQIDVLQRLQCERGNVEKALKNLPRTLNEIYDKILLAMPHEELVIASHILEWISFHNETHSGDGIPCEVLLQAIGKSTAELTTNDLERFYDNDTLRELCGCLIKIVPQDNTKHTETCIKHTTLAVSFAHYTVREYLDPRCSKNTVVSSTIPKKELRQHMLGVVFSEAHHIKFNDLWEVRHAPMYQSDVLDAITGNLSEYCVVSAILSLFKWPTEISQQEKLYSAAIDLLDPSKPHFEALKRAASMIEASVMLFTQRADVDLVLEQLFWTFHWHEETSDMVAVHFLYLLLLVENEVECLPLAEKFLQAKDTRDFLKARLRFERYVWGSCGYKVGDFYILDGSIIEVYAQVTTGQDLIFPLLLDYGAGLFDCSKVLLLNVGCHEHEFEEDGFCPLRRLLALGADPNSRGSRITPLQIAVDSDDLDGVRTLLDAGADPNDTGSSGETLWEDGTVMSQFNCLDGASALYICRNFECNDNSRKESRRMIEETLLQYGAKEFLRT